MEIYGGFMTVATIILIAMLVYVIAKTLKNG